MKIRLHRGSLTDSMATVSVRQATTDAIRAYLAEHGIDANAIEVARYGLDERIGWDCHLVLVDGYPMAWTDEMPGENYPTDSEKQGVFVAKTAKGFLPKFR